MDAQKKEGGRAFRLGFDFTWKAVLVIVAIGADWPVIGAFSHPSHRTDATAVGVSEETTPPVAANGFTIVSEGVTSTAAATPTKTTPN